MSRTYKDMPARLYAERLPGGVRHARHSGCEHDPSRRGGWPVYSTVEVGTRRVRRLFVRMLDPDGRPVSVAGDSLAEVQRRYLDHEVVLRDRLVLVGDDVRWEAQPVWFYRWVDEPVLRRVITGWKPVPHLVECDLGSRSPDARCTWTHWPRFYTNVTSDDIRASSTLPERAYVRQVLDSARREWNATGSTDAEPMVRRRRRGSMWSGGYFD